MWIRSPAWDGFWILSGIPFGAALTGISFYFSAPVMVLWIILLTQTGHLLSPMALAWSHDGFRAVMLTRPIKFIMIPIAIPLVAAVIGFIGGRTLPNLRFDPNSFSLAAGPTTLAEFTNPFMAMVALYAVWNSFHFGRQAFGVLSIYRRKNERQTSASGAIHYDHSRLSRMFYFINFSSRTIDLWYCCAVIWAAMAMPFIPRIAEGIHNLTGWPAQPRPFLDHVQLAYLAAGLALPAAMLVREWFTYRSPPRAIFILTDGLALILIFHAGLWGFAIIGINHWLTATGIASHVHANHTRLSPWTFAIMINAIGFALFCLLFIDLHKLTSTGFTSASLIFSTTTVGLRLGLGFVHFLYDRSLYLFSNQEVRNTIGLDILRNTAPLPARIDVRYCTLLDTELIRNFALRYTGRK